MAKDKKVEGSFGLDDQVVGKIDWSLALSRVLADVRTDFIWAPHIRAIYRRAGDALVEQVKSELKSGRFAPGMPLTIEVPKSFRMWVGTTPGQGSNTGPSFTRPGSILLPKDRLLYQAIADQCAPLVDEKTNKKRSFSHRLSLGEDDNMFLSNRECWSQMQKALKTHSKIPRFEYVVKLDISDYFRSINQHQLVNTLADAGLEPSLTTRLEAILLKYTGQKSSRGIIQGVNTSDLFGSFYLNPIDRQFLDRRLASVRYVDDIYVFVPSLRAADKVLSWLIPTLRVYDLTLNETKSVVMPKARLKVDEPDLEELFDEAMAEAADQGERATADGYGFQKAWDDDDEDEEEEQEDQVNLKIEATKLLFDSIGGYAKHEEQIERFCIPLFTAAESDYAVDYVLTAFKMRPSMTQIYMSYLINFLDRGAVRTFLLAVLRNAAFYDWQKMWVIAGLVQHDSATPAAVSVVSAILEDGERHEALRAAAAIFVTKFGNHSRRLELFETFKSVPEYVQAALYFGTRRWPDVERRNARSAWSRDTHLFHLISATMEKR